MLAKTINECENKVEFTTQKCHWLWFLHTFAAWNIMFIFFLNLFCIELKKREKNTIIEALPLFDYTDCIQ